MDGEEEVNSKMTGYNRAQVLLILADKVELTEEQAEVAMKTVDGKPGKRMEISKKITVTVTRHGDYYAVELP